MSLSTYADLKSMVATLSHRSDLSALIDDLVRMAEVRVFHDVRTPDQEATQAISTSAGTGSYTVPSDLIAPLRLTLAHNVPHDLPMIDPSVAQTNVQGVPASWHIEAGQISLYPVPDDSYSLTLLYRRRLPSLVEEVNALYSKFPDLYLHATMAEVATYLQDDAMLQRHDGRYQAAVIRANRTNTTRRAAILTTEIGSAGLYDIRSM